MAKKGLETCAVLALASLVLIGWFRGKEGPALELAVGFLAVGLFVPPAAEFIHWAWMKLATWLATFNSRLLLSLIFFLVLTPLSKIRRFFGKADPLDLSPPAQTLFKDRPHTYTPSDLEKPY